jgi:hypothetical protein
MPTMANGTKREANSSQTAEPRERKSDAARRARESEHSVAPTAAPQTEPVDADAEDPYDNIACTD